jgi:hypothetical protein
MRSRLGDRCKTINEEYQLNDEIDLHEDRGPELYVQLVRQEPKTAEDS